MSSGSETDPVRGWWRNPVYIIIAASLTLASVASAQTNLPVPVVGKAAGVGVSTPLSEIKPSSLATNRPSHRVLPIHPLRTRGRRRFGAGAETFDPIVQTFSLAPAAPAPTLSFEGISNLDNVDTVGQEVIPPDPNGDVGPNHYVQAVNLSLCVFDKSTGAPVTSPIALTNLFTGFGGLCEAGIFNSDPVVLYDALADRWFVSFLASDADILGNPAPPFHQCVACSQGTDPAGAYYLYDFQMPNSWLNDYPKFGVWPDAYYMTDNQFDAASEEPHGAGVFALDRTKMLSGDPSASFIYFNLEPVDPNIDGVLPADVDGPPPPIGTPNYLACLSSANFGDPQGDGLRLFEFHADFVHPANSTFTERPDSPVGVAPFLPLFFCQASAQACIPQPPPAGKTSYLDAIADRLMHRLQYRNFGSNESLVVNHTVNVGGNHAGVRYYQLQRNLPGGSFVVNEQASYAPDANHRWMGSAAMDRAGNLAVGYSVSSTNTFPSIRYAGRLATDPHGGLFQGEATLQAGAGSQTDPSSRWGDYSMLAVDPADDCTFWYTTEYYSDSSDQDWQTRIGSFKFSNCASAPKGTLQGTVTDAKTGLIISNAVIRTATGFLRTTSGTGTYSMSLPADTYSVTASALNHKSVTVTGIVVANGGTVTQNFVLSPAPVLVLSSVIIDDAAGNHNGVIDVNECIGLKVFLQNTGAADASNVVAALSTTTPGVTVAMPLSTYPNLAIGASNTNSTEFRITVAPSFTCGAPIDLDLTASYTGGTNDVPIHLNTGSIGAATRFDASDTPVDISPILGATSSNTVSGIAASIAKVTVSLYMTSDDNSQLDVYLVGPDNTTVALATSTRAFGQNYGTACSPDGSRTTFDDAASTSIYDGSPPFTGSYKPEQSLSSAFNGKSGSAVNGTWTLVVGNFLGTASLECWSLNVSQPVCSDGGGACVVADTVGDGIPDWWRQTYFGGNGTTTNSQSCATCDADHTGQNNLFKYVAGLNPTNPTSVFTLKIAGVAGQSNQKNLIYNPVVAGRTYTVQSNTNLVGGVYTNLTASSGPQTNGTQATVTDLNATQSTKFYRVHISLP